MPRIFFVSGCAILVCSVALFSWNSPQKERSLHPDELFRLYGGEGFHNTQCFEHPSCIIALEDGCIGPDEEDCETQTDAEDFEVNYDGCWATSPGIYCEHFGDNLCARYYVCEWKPATGTCDKTWNSDVRNPDDCVDNI